MSESAIWTYFVRGARTTLCVREVPPVQDIEVLMAEEEAAVAALEAAEWARLAETHKGHNVVEYDRYCPLCAEERWIPSISAQEWALIEADYDAAWDHW